MTTVNSSTDKTTTTWYFPIHPGKINIVPDPMSKKITLIFRTMTASQEFFEKYRSFEDPKGQKYSLSLDPKLFSLTIPLRACDEKPVTAALNALSHAMNSGNYQFTYSE